MRSFSGPSLPDGCAPIEVTSGKPSAGSCSLIAGSAEACKALASGLPDLPGEAVAPVGASRPSGCWWQPSNHMLFFNPHGVEEMQCSDAIHCICCGAGVARVDGSAAGNILSRTAGPKLVGGCGGEPFLDPNTGDYQSEAGLAPYLKGAFQDCSRLCAKMKHCIKFQQEDATGRCYFSGALSSSQSFEPNDDLAWSCSMLEPPTAAQPVAMDVHVLGQRYTLVVKPGEDVGEVVRNFQHGHLLTDNEAKELEAYITDYLAAQYSRR